MAYSKEFKHRIVKHVKLGISLISQIAQIRRVPRQTIYRWLKRYRMHDLTGLENRAPGAKETKISYSFERMVTALWCERNLGVHKMWLRLQEKGFTVSERQIQKVYRKNKLKMNKRERPSQIKFVTYEAIKPNLLWHTDWTTCPYTGKQIIAFIDDHSRFIVHAECFDNATTENTIKAFEKAIKAYGRPESILTDNGPQFTPARAEKGPFTEWCEQRGIKHILGRVHHPQTNGKIERWFGTYKQEFKNGEDTLQSFVNYYNYERAHQGIGYKVPSQRYESNINAV